MKKVFTLSLVACCMLIFQNTKAQVRITTSESVLSTLPPISGSSFDKLRVQGGLISHFASGTVGSFGATDKWIGIGAPLSSLYGNRVQWNGQALNSALRERTAGGIKDALIEWGNGGGEMQFRYITNPNVSTGFTKVLSLTALGNAYFGLNPSSAFLGIQLNPAGGPPFFIPRVINPQLEVNSTSEISLGVKNSTGLSGFFKNDFSDCLKAESGADTYQNSTTTRAFTAIAKNGAVNYGVDATASINGPISSPFGNPTATNVGIRGSAEGGFNTFGVLGSSSGSQTCYGIYGDVSPSAGGLGYAGYFNGTVIANNYTTFSDRNLKKSIATESNNIIDKIAKLRPVTYNYDNKISPDMVLPKTLQHGFIAQEMQEVFPEVVTEIAHPVFKDKKLVETKRVLGVNYNMLVSILTKAIQEENAKIKNLESRIAELESKLAISLQKSVSSSTSVVENIKGIDLYQNIPNPFGSSTTISYSLPANIKNASIAIFDLTGKMVLKFDNIINGKSQVVIDGNKLSSGIYLYSLILNGVEIETKRMIVNK